MREDVGAYVGFPSNPAGWSFAELRLVDDAIRAGEEQFNNPPVLKENLCLLTASLATSRSSATCS